MAERKGRAKSPRRKSSLKKKSPSPRKPKEEKAPTMPYVILFKISHKYYKLTKTEYDEVEKQGDPTNTADVVQNIIRPFDKKAGTNVNRPTEDDFSEIQLFKFENKADFDSAVKALRKKLYDENGGTLRFYVLAAMRKMVSTPTLVFSSPAFDQFFPMKLDQWNKILMDTAYKGAKRVETGISFFDVENIKKMEIMNFDAVTLETQLI